MEKDKKLSSSYSMLKDLDKVVQKDKKREHSDSSNGHRRKRSYSPRRRSRSPPRRNSPKRRDNYKKEKIEIVELLEDIDHDIPDRSYGDLYCKACDSHMNSEQMWDAHIRGKRHLKQIKKGESDHKYEAVDQDPIILPEIKNVKEPIVGLQHCCEIQRMEGKPTYQCFLCSASIATSELLIEHVIGLKHRMAYLKEHDKDNYTVIMKADLKKGMIEPVVEEYVQKLEDEKGPGKMPVKIEKPRPKETWGPVNKDKKASSPINRKRPYQDDLDYKTSGFGSRDSYDSLRNEDSDFRAMPERTRDYSRGYPIDDKYSGYSDLPRANSPWRHDLYERNEGAFSRRRSLTPPPRSEISYGRSYITDLNTRDTNSTWNKIDKGSEYVDLRHVLEKRRMQEMNAKAAAPKPSVFESLLSLVEDLPNMMFLELILHKVERMNPSETELSMLKKIADFMYKFVMEKRIEKDPNVITKAQERIQIISNSISQGSLYQNATSDSSVNTSSTITSIQNLLDLFKNPGQVGEASSQNQTFPPQNIQSQPVYTSAVKEAAFSTQSSSLFYNLWGAPSTSKDSTAIPGLTLSSTQESFSDNRLSYPQDQSDERYASRKNVWSPTIQGRF